MGKVLELESLEEPEKVDVIAAVDLGSLYHNILRDFYKTLIGKRYFDTKTKEINPIELLHDITQKYFTEIEQRIPIPYPTLWEIKKEEILTFLIRFITWDLEHIEQTGYVPTYLERSVKLCSQDNLLKLIPICVAQGESSRIRLKGKLDRIDLKVRQDVTNFRVVDYKSGKFSKENLIRSAVRGQKLQLPFYIIMAEHLLSEQIKKGRIPQGRANMEDAFFVYIAQDRTDKKGQKDIPAHTIKGNDWNDFQEQYWETVKEFLQYIREGMFPISPTEDTQKCEWCEFATTCRRGHQPLRFRLEQDARLKKYRDILKTDVNKKSNKT